jgi:aspartokinase-like uncharacterized kinase
MMAAGAGVNGDVSAVVKIGGGILRAPEQLQRVLEAIADAAADNALLVVPGGGPFADTVRAVDRDVGLTDDAAHWMAVLAMDQYAHLLCARLRGGVIVTSPLEISLALAAGELPVLASSRWLRETDPLPHSWEVTSDSIAAWIAGALGARTLVLVKPAGVHNDGSVDGYFTRALRAETRHVILSADRAGELRLMVRDSAGG